MNIHLDPWVDPPGPCPYIPAELQSLEHFVATGVNARELDMVLSSGWRLFGPDYFRPACPSCRQCVPVRVLTGQFTPSKSQRRTMRRCAGVRVCFGPREASPDILRIYQEHARARFAREATRDEMERGFYSPSCPSLQSTYHLGGELIAAGFIDKSANALSSAYFVYTMKYADLGLGAFSVMTEIEYARRLGLRYYYLGYCIGANTHMAYKARFRPQERYDWVSRRWVRGTDE